MDMSALLPVWIIGAPLLVAIVERFTNISDSFVGSASSARPSTRPTLPGAR